MKDVDTECKWRHCRTEHDNAICRRWLTLETELVRQLKLMLNQKLVDTFCRVGVSLLLQVEVAVEVDIRLAVIEVGVEADEVVVLSFTASLRAIAHCVSEFC